MCAPFPHCIRVFLSCCLSFVGEDVTYRLVTLLLSFNHILVISLCDHSSNHMVSLIPTSNHHTLLCGFRGLLGPIIFLCARQGSPERAVGALVVLYLHFQSYAVRLNRRVIHRGFLAVSGVQYIIPGAPTILTRPFLLSFRGSLAIPLLSFVSSQLACF